MTNYKALNALFQGYVEDMVPLLLERADRHFVCFDISDEFEEAFAGFVLAYGSDAGREEAEDSGDFASRRAAFVRDVIAEMLRLSAFHGVQIPPDDFAIALRLNALVSPGRVDDEIPAYFQGHLVGYENRATGAIRYRISTPSIKR